MANKLSLESKLRKFNNILACMLTLIVLAFWAMYFALNEVFYSGAVFYTQVLFGIMMYSYIVRTISALRPQVSLQNKPVA